MPLDVLGGTKPAEIRVKHPDLALIGGINRLALAAGRESIRREIEGTARVLLRKGKSIPSIDVHGVDADDVPFENIRYYARGLRKEAEAATCP